MRIIESEIATEFGVSHGPVREALRQLEQEGVVEYTRNIGCSVKNISLSDVIEVLLIRGSYELTAVRACGGNISDQALQKMSDTLEAMKYMNDSDFMEPIVFDNEFHRILVCESRIPYLMKAWDALDFVTFFIYYNENEPNPALVQRQYNVHKNIFDVYLTRDCRAICNQIYDHYNGSINRMLRNNHMSQNDFPFSFDIIRP